MNVRPRVEIEPPHKSQSTRRIQVIDVIKEFDSETGRRRVLNGISFEVGLGERVAILGGNGAGKTTLIRIIAGLLNATSGQIVRGLNMSWPLALGGGFEGSLTGYDNIRFISRMYNVPYKETCEYVEDFTELGSQLHELIRFYSTGMRMRLAFALTMSINFECFLIDEVILVGDRRFQEKCHREIFERRAHCAMIMAVHATDVVKDYCTSALILKNGHGRVFTDIGRACDIYVTL